ncbi:hypothetical protein SDC9_130780 [bioreactor metagenome]|uniref:Uncharacterized protein n=1 Tax=bioreactor metagenome TaxID=1076179 RepID=A0A645D3H9_9ZZZZ
MSPIFGAYIIRKNWILIGDKKAAKCSTFWLLGLVILYFALCTIAVDYVKYIALPVLIIWYALECKPQVKFLKEQKVEYEKLSWLKPLGIAFVCLISWLLVVSLIGGGHSNSEISADACPIVEKILKGNYNLPNLKCERLFEITKDKSEKDTYFAKAVVKAEGEKIIISIKIEYIDDMVQVTILQ